MKNFSNDLLVKLIEETKAENMFRYPFDKNKSKDTVYKLNGITFDFCVSKSYQSKVCIDAIDNYGITHTIVCYTNKQLEKLLNTKVM